MCDIELACKDSSIKCHKLILSASSEYFKDIFLAENQNADVVVLSDIDMTILSDVVKFIYSGTCALSNKNVAAILDASVNLKLGSLQTLCETYIKHNLNLTIVIDCYQIAIKHELEDLILTTSEYVVYHFTALCELKQLDLLLLENFCHLVLCNSGMFINEDKVLESVISWAVANAPQESDTTSLFDIVQYERVSIDYLFDVQEHDILQHHPQMGYVRNAIKQKYKQKEEVNVYEPDTAYVSMSSISKDGSIPCQSPPQLPPRQQLFRSASAKVVSETRKESPMKRERKQSAVTLPDIEMHVQKCMDVTNLYLQKQKQHNKLIMVNNQKEMTLYENTSSEWDIIALAPAWIDKGTTLATYKLGAIFVSAEEKSASRLITLVNLTTQREMRMVDIPGPICKGGVAYVAGHIYIIGGRCVEKKYKTTGVVYRLCVNSTRTWEKIGSLKVNVTDPCVSHDEDHIYIFGSNQKKSTDHHYVQVYNIETSAWKIVKNLPTPCSLFTDCCMHHNNLIYLLQPSSCMSYHRGSNSWNINMYEKIGDGLNAMEYEGRVIVAVKDNDNLLSYDLNENLWSIEEIDTSQSLSHEHIFTLRFVK